MLAKNQVEECLMSSLLTLMVINTMCSFDDTRLEMFKLILLKNKYHPNNFSDKPHNPLLNSGAIMSSAILLNKIRPDMKMSEKFDYVTDYLRKMAGGEFVG